MILFSLSRVGLEKLPFCEARMKKVESSCFDDNMHHQCVIVVHCLRSTRPREVRKALRGKPARLLISTSTFKCNFILILKFGDLERSRSYGEDLEIILCG